MLPAFLAAGLTTLITTTASASPSHLLSRQTILADLPGAWAFFGCFEDNANAPGVGRSLTGASFVNSTGMSVEACVNFCNNQSFIYAGLEFGQECYCDNVFEHVEESVGNNECTKPCSGNPAELCGGPDRLSVYTSGTAAVFPALVPSIGPWVALGCYNDTTSARALQRRVNAGNTTVESCTAACQTQGFTLAGLEFGQECWCGSRLLNGSVFVGNDNGISGTPPVRQTGSSGMFCSMGCEGNSSELCGGPARLNLYNFTGPVATTVLAVQPWVFLGCYNDSTSGRTLRTQAHPSGGVTAESCTAACHDMNFSLAGLEFGQECWCDKTFENGGIGPTDPSACNMACTANGFEICGGPLALTVYQFENVTAEVNDFATLTSLTNNLTTLVNSVTASNADTLLRPILTDLFNIGEFTVPTGQDAFGGFDNEVEAIIIGPNAVLIVNALDQWASSVQELSNALVAKSSLLGPVGIALADPVSSQIQNLINFTFVLTVSILANEVIHVQAAGVFAAMASIDNALQQALATYPS